MTNQSHDEFQNDALQAELQDYLDDRLSPDQVAALESRLQADDSLRDQLESLRRVGDFVRAAMPSGTDLEAPENFTESVRERIDAEAIADSTARARRKTWGRVLAFSYAAAALLVAGLSVHWMFTHPSRDQASRDQASPGQTAREQQDAETERTAKKATERKPTAAEIPERKPSEDAASSGLNELRKADETIASDEDLGADAPAQDLNGASGGRTASGSRKAKGSKREAEGKSDDALRDAPSSDAPSSGTPGKHRQPGGALPPGLRAPKEADKAPAEGRSVPPDARSRRQRKDAARVKQDQNAPEVYLSLREPSPMRARVHAHRLAKLLTPTGDTAKDARQARQFNALALQVQLVQVDATGRVIGSFRVRGAPELGSEAPSDRDSAEQPKPLRTPVNKSSGPGSFDDTWPREVLTRLLAQRVAVQRDNSAPAREDVPTDGEQPGAAKDEKGDAVPLPPPTNGPPVGPTPPAGPSPASPAPDPSKTAPSKPAPSRVRIRFFHR